MNPNVIGRYFVVVAVLGAAGGMVAHGVFGGPKTALAVENAPPIERTSVPKNAGLVHFEHSETTTDQVLLSREDSGVVSELWTLENVDSGRSYTSNYVYNTSVFDVDPGSSAVAMMSSGAGSAGSAPSGSGGSGESSGGGSGGGSSGGTPSDSGDTGGGGLGGGGVNPAEYVLPDWIQKEGIRAGFMSSTAGDLSVVPAHINAARNNGLNTAIVYGCSFAETPNHLTYYKHWLRLCNQAGLHVFAFYPWQPPVGNACRPVVFADGSDGLFPCPLDNRLWQQYFMGDMAGKLAPLSVESPQTLFEGFFLDMEMYRTEEQPEAKKHYSYDTCYCDYCFSTFILNRTSFRELPPVRKDRRKSWLTQNHYLTDYHAYLTLQVEERAKQLRDSVRSVNPKLLFGVYPALNDSNWVRNAVMRAFGRDSYPAISFTTDTYGYFGNRISPSTWGANRIPADLDAYFDKYDINGIYVAGYLFRAYTSSEIKEHLIKSVQRSQGYWLYRIPQLTDDDIPESERLAGGTQADYLRAIKDANTYLRTP